MERYYYIPQGAQTLIMLSGRKKFRVLTVHGFQTLERHWNGWRDGGDKRSEHPAPDESVINAVRDHILPLHLLPEADCMYSVPQKKLSRCDCVIERHTANQGGNKIRTESLMFRDGVPEGRMYLSRISELSVYLQARWPIDSSTLHRILPGGN